MKQGNYNHFALPVRKEAKDNLSETLNDIKFSIYALDKLSQNLNLRSISISKTSKINHIAWEEIKLIFDLVFANPFTKIIVCKGIRQYPTKEQRSQLTEESYSSTLGDHSDVTKAHNRIRQ